MPAAAGQRPSHAGYASGSGSSEREIVRAIQATARPIARHGLNARKTSPNRIEMATGASQKITKMKIGVQLAVVLWVPANPAQIVSANRKIPIAPQTISTGRLASA